MNKTTRTTLSLMILLFSASIYAIPVPPNITNNVTVLQNITATQCPSDWKGSVAPEIVNVVSDIGSEDEETSPGILSCTGCQFNASARTCVCSTCYDDSDLD